VIAVLKEMGVKSPSSEQIKYVRALFDTNKDGKLAKEELKHVLREMA